MFAAVNFTRISYHNRIIRNIPVHKTTGSNQNIISNCHIANNSSINTYINSIPNCWNACTSSTILSANCTAFMKVHVST